MRDSSLTPWRQWTWPTWHSMRGNQFPELDDFFDDAWNMFPRMLTPSTRNEVSYAPVCDIRESDKEYVVAMDVPGMAKENISIEVSGNTIYVSGERKQEREHRDKEGHRSHVTERRFGRFERSFKLPSDADVSHVKATCDGGVLEIEIPKAKEAKRSRIAIESSGVGKMSKPALAPNKTN